jgi:DNA repair exonuclease SbcCD ATPase subunit
MADNETEITQGGLTNEEIEKVTEAVRQIVALREQINALDERKKALTSFVRSKLKATKDLYKFGPRTVTVVQTTVFSDVQARKVLTLEQLAAVMVTRTEVSEELAKAVLPPNIYENCRVPRGVATVTVK